MRVRLAKYAGLILVAVFAGLMARAADAPVPQFQAGDRVCFIGDSITHGGRYTSFIHMFYATRFPERKWEFFNAGVSGDSAGGAVRRFDWDIAPHKPTVATIMLGMNDVGRGLYGEGKTGEQIEKQRKNCLDGHTANMKKLAELLKQAECRMIFITPSIYDQTGQLKAENNAGVNDALATCGDYARGLAPEFGGTVVDFNGPMTEINAREQAKDAVFTIVGQDRVHPGGVGHLIMAYLFLTSQQMPPLVARIAVDAKTAAVADAANCTVSEVKGAPDGVAFVCAEKALPFPVPGDAAGALKLVPFMEDLNQELLVVANLAPGNYDVLIDDAVVATAAAEHLAKGLNLAGNVKTPMYKQALEVQKHENNRHGILSGKLRSLAAARHFAPKDVNPDDYEAMKKAKVEAVEKLKDKPNSNYAYFKGQTDIYVNFKPKEAELYAEVAKETDEIWKLNQPVPHRFVIRMAQAAAPAAPAPAPVKP